MTTYAYDAVGNPQRADMVDSVNSGNELIWANGLYHNYDADGNVFRRFKPSYGAVQYLSWNTLGQLTGVSNAPIAGSGWTLTDSVTFGYDGWGRRVRKTDVTTGVTTTYIWDGADLVATIQGGTLARYAAYPGVDRPHSVTVGAVGQPGATYYYVQDDAPGNVLGLATAGGGVAASYQYTPWGQASAASESGLPAGWSNPLRFAGREYDAETGLYYNRARYYDPTLQRFLSPDPTGLGGGINWYAYAGNDPVNYRDPSGKCTDDEALAFSYTQDEDGNWSESRACPGGGIDVFPSVTSPITSTPGIPGFECLTCGSFTSPFGPGLGGPGAGSGSTAPQQAVRQTVPACSTQSEWQFSGGGSATIAAGLGLGIVASVSLNFGVTSSGRVFGQLQGAFGPALGYYLGAGLGGGVAKSSGTPTGVSTSNGVFGAGGFGPFSGMVTRSSDGYYGGSGGYPRFGPGIGAFAGGGTYGAVTLASPSLTGRNCTP